MLGKGAALYIAETQEITKTDYVANVTTISGFEKSRNMIAVEAALNEDSDTI